MEVGSARATLVDSTGNGATVLTTLPRSEVEEALRIEGDPPDLVLDVTRYAGEGEAQTSSTATVSVSWARGDLEEVLRRSEGDVVTIGFDGEALLRAFDEDVEAHGLREAAALLAVTVAAGSAAGVAMAQPAEGAGATATPAVAQADYGVPRAMPGDYSAAQPGEYGAPRAMPSDYQSQPGEYGAPRAMPSDYQSQPGEYGAPRAMPSDYESQPSEYGAPRAMPSDYQSQPGEYGAPRAMPTDYESQPSEYGMPRAMPTDYAQPAEYGMPRAMPSDYVAEPTGGGGIHVTMPGPEATGAIIGAFALLITGAAFAARRRVTPAT
jgi:hypothetical protein